MEHTPITKPAWFVIGMAAVLLALLLALGLGWAPRGGSLAEFKALRAPTRPSSPEGKLAVVLPPSATPTLTPTAAPTETPTPTATATMTRRPTSTPPPTTPTAVPPTPRPTPAPYVGLAERLDHYWMIRPVAAGAVSDSVARFYPYGSRQDGSYPVHHGVEFVNPMGTPVLAVADGEIVMAGGDQLRVVGARDDFYGQVIVLRLNRTLHGEAVYALYGHLSEIDVSVGQRVSTGQALGKVGMSGYAEGPHLHFEVRVGANSYERTVNPELWLQPLAGRGTLAGMLLDNAGVLASEEVRLVITAANGSARYEVYTYPAREVNPDPAFLESWCLGDLTAGNWTVSAFYRNQLFEEVVRIEPGQTTWLELRASR